MPATRIIIHERTGSIAHAVLPHLQGEPVRVQQTRSAASFQKALQNNPYSIVLIECEPIDAEIGMLLREAALWQSYAVVVTSSESWSSAMEMRELGVRALLAPGMLSSSWGPFLGRLIQQSQRCFQASP